jgi:uncharacterized membrane protein
MKKISYKKYRIYKLIIAIILVAIISTFVSLDNFIAALIAFAVSIILIIILRRKVRVVLNDERTENIGGKASRMVLTIFALLMATAGIVLVSLRDASVQYLIIGNILLFTECGMMLLYAILFKYYSNKGK